MKTFLTHEDILFRAAKIAAKINTLVENYIKEPIHLCPVPRGGIPALYAVLNFVKYEYKIVTQELADVFIDDIIDSGFTRDKWLTLFPSRSFLALVNKKDEKEDKNLGWLVFPWEHKEDGEQGLDETVRRLLQFIGEDPDREGLKETPKRLVKALEHWYGGYKINPASVLKVFTDGAENCDEMIVVQDIPFFSHCEHHMAPMIGTATIGYIPDGRIIGLSKLPRLLDIFARRMQVQERLTSQVAEALEDLLSPLGCGIIVKARHLCMESRGVEKSGTFTTTSALRGVFKTNAATRAEFMALK